MKIVIFGLGYVGFTAACCIASQGHTVIGVDVSKRKVDAINAGKTPIIEPQVAEMLQTGLAQGLIEARTEIGDALEGADLGIVCVGTPSAADGSHNMGYVADVTRQIAQALAKRPRTGAPLAIAYRSTFRPGTVDELVWPVLASVLDSSLTWALARLLASSRVTTMVIHTVSRNDLERNRLLFCSQRRHLSVDPQNIGCFQPIALVI